jgi:hypothetical protein
MRGGPSLHLRFIATEKDRDSHRHEGVFQAIDALLDSYDSSAVERHGIRALLTWFGKNPAVPARFSRSSRANAQPKAISWFKPSASEHIARMRELVDLLEQHGCRCRMIKESRVGYITYEDDDQIVAVPFSDTRA